MRRLWRDIPIAGRRTLSGWALLIGTGVLTLWPSWVIDDYFIALGIESGDARADTASVVVMWAIRCALLCLFVLWSAIATARMGRHRAWTIHMSRISALLFLLGGLVFVWCGGASAERGGADFALRRTHTWVTAFPSYLALSTLLGVAAALILQHMRAGWIVAGSVSTFVVAVSGAAVLFACSAEHLHTGVPLR